MMTNMISSPAMPDRQRQFARQMRAQPTDAERVLWQRLRHDIALAGSHFRRQVVVGPFIVDFASRRAKIVIELDGGQHNWQQASDASRQHQIEAAGYRVLRFWNHDVLGNLDGVLTEIQSALTPTPDPSPQGGGEKKPRRPRQSRRPPKGLADVRRKNPRASLPLPLAGRGQGWGSTDDDGYDCNPCCGRRPSPSRGG
jgi:very-short-patch-repair endonuclease